MGYRVDLARSRERAPAKAAALQEQLVAWDRQRADGLLALPCETPLHGEQRNRLRTLGVSVLNLGEILREAGDAGCVACYQEAIDIRKSIGDKIGQAISEYKLGCAYPEVPSVRNLDAAEDAYQRSLDLHESHNAPGRSKCIKQIGMVHQVRFYDGRERREPADAIILHAQAAEGRYREALELRPKDAFTDLAPLHNQMAVLYSEFGQFERAREHFEKAAQCYERFNRFKAGETRRNMAIMSLGAAGDEDQPATKRDILHRAQADAEAALRDYQHDEGRDAAGEANTQTLLDHIRQVLAQLPR